LILNERYFPQWGRKRRCEKIDIQDLFNLIACA